jgi:hypothetical protein
MFVWFLFAVFSAVIAVNRGRSGIGWFLIGGIFGVFGLLVAALPRIERDSDRDDDARKCPYCAEVVKAEAIKCRFCQSTLVPIEPIEEEEPPGLTAWGPVYVIILAVLGPLAFVWIF